jgi:alkyl hydroperoxide reductase subunit AhpC
VKVGQPAPDFQLPDTEGKSWRLSDFRGKKPVVLIWVFADWCPVCHGEFHELIELRQRFEAANAQVFTLECHDLFPCRVMVGKELEPKYWFRKTSFKDAYTKNIWWPHLVDRAGGVGAEYGVQPMSFTVHAEWINRPSVVIVDKEGVGRFAYYGTFWGDRPSIHQLLEMVRSGKYSFDAPKRLKPRVQALSPVVMAATLSEYPGDASVLIFGNMNLFETKLAEHRLTLRRGERLTLQINVGRKCNQTCRHCHVGAAPWRTEMMPKSVAQRVGEWIRQHRPSVVDITGGAPELSEHFRYFVETARDCGCHVIDRCNLTIIETEAFAWLPEYLAQYEVEVIASLPCYSADNVNAQRGNGVFEKSIAALK